MNLLDLVKRPWQGVREAKAAAEMSEAEREKVEELVQDLRRIHTENHIAAKVHAAFRGE